MTIHNLNVAPEDFDPLANGLRTEILMPRGVGVGDTVRIREQKEGSRQFGRQVKVAVTFSRQADQNTVICSVRRLKE